MVNHEAKLKTVLIEPQLLQNGNLKVVSVELKEVMEQQKRLDASFYDIEGKKARQLVANCPFPKWALFGENTSFAKEAFYPIRFKRVYLPAGIPFFVASQSLESNPKPEKFISTKTDVDLETVKLKSGQITVTRSGSIGHCCLVSKTLDGKVFSDDLIRITCSNPEDIGFVYAFLKTKIGNKVLTTNNYGSVVTHIEPEHLQHVQVPVLPGTIRKKANDSMALAVGLRDEANILFEEAEQLISKRLNLPPLSEMKAKYLDPSEKLRTYDVPVSLWSRRLDASYHVPIIDAIIEHLEKSPAELTTVGDKRVTKEIVLPGRFKRVYVTEEYGVPFLSGGDILEFDPVGAKFLSPKHHGKRISDELTLHENMILVTCSGTIGNVVLAPKHFENWTANQHILRIIPSEETNVGYTYAFLASSYGKELIKRFKYGSVVDEIDDHQLAAVDFPLVSKTVQDEIGDKVLEANRKVSEAYYTEKKTISWIDDEIRQSKKLL
jgi:type I restriction enzyme S subunit